MGVSGSGKTTVGRKLATRLRWSYIDADDHHTPENVAKMRSGIPLTDEDRWPWLERLRELLQEHMARGEPIVLACSALKNLYRERLEADDPHITLIYLRGTPALIRQRLLSRTDHYFDPDLLQSQFEALEEPKAATIIDVNDSPETIVERILNTTDLTPFTLKETL